MKRPLKRVALLILIGLLLSAATVWFLFGSRTGVTWLVRAADLLVPADLSVARVEGNLLGELRLDNIEFQNRNLRITVGTASLSWLPGEMLRGLFHVRALTADQVEYVRRTDVPEDETDSPWAEPVVHALPLEIRLDRFQARSLSLITAPGADPLVISDVSLAGGWRGSRAEISRLMVRLDDPDPGMVAALEVDLAGGVEFTGEPRFDLDGDWRNLRWPLTGPARVFSRSGRVTLSGTVAEYGFSLDAAVDGADIPAGTWRLRGRGSSREVKLTELDGSLLGGAVSGGGRVAWQPALAWDMRLRGEKINPGVMWPGYVGSLNFRLVSSGSRVDENLALTATIEKLEGIFNDQPVWGTGQVVINGDDIEVRDLELASGRARLTVAGFARDRLDLNWTLDVADIGDLLPEGGGRVQGRGVLRGSREKPVLKGDLEVRDLRVAETRLGRMDGRFLLGLDDAFQSELSVSARDLRLGGQVIQSLDMELAGSPSDHRLTLAVTREQRRLELAARGAWFQEKRSWQGDIQELELQGGEEGHWRLDQVAALVLSPGRISVAPLCLLSGGATLCGRADRSEAGGEAGLTLKGLAMERFRPWLPAAITEFSGVLNLDVRADLAEPIQVRAAATISPGVLAVRDAAPRPVILEHHDTRLTLDLDREELTAGWHANLGPHLVSGDLRISRPDLEEDAMAASMQGRIRLAMVDLDLVSALVPEISKVEGRLDLDLDLGGSLGDPRLSGRGVLEAGSVLVPSIGLALNDLFLEARGEEGGNIVITGAAASGNGSLTLAGTLDPAADQGWPARVTIKGEGFQLVNLPEARVQISPDLVVSNSRESLMVRGKVVIPEARIELEEVPSGSRGASPDVVVLGSGEPEEELVPPSPLDVEVTLKGERIHFKGMGLNADLAGQVALLLRDGRPPAGSGELKIVSGSYRAYGQDLTLDKGLLAWAGGRLTNPGLHLRADRRIDDVVVGVRVSGTAEKPKLSVFSSDPDISDKDALAMLLTGQKMDNLGRATFYTGTQITPDLSVGVNMGGGEEGTEFVTRYRLRPNLFLEGTSSGVRSGGRISYSFDVE